MVKEADALAEAGFDVTLVSGSYFAPASLLDDAILRRARWRHVAVPLQRGRQASARRLLRRLLRAARVPCRTLGLARMRACPEWQSLASAASSVRASLYHSHCLGGLVAAVAAARDNRAVLGFDAEDFHEEETDAVMRDPHEQEAIRLLLRHHLPETKLLTAASPCIAEAFRLRHGVGMQVVLNAFEPVDTRTGYAGPFTISRPAKLYWFSQTVGPGRGLEQAVAILDCMNTPAEMWLRGFVRDDYRREIARLGSGRAERIKFLPPGAPDDMVAMAAEADAGLALELPHPPNRDMCLTNKVFVYLAAGLPQIMSATTAQVGFARDLGDAALVVDLNNAEAAAREIDGWLGAPSKFAQAAASAREMGRRYSWSVERGKFLAAVDSALGGDARS